MKLVITDSKEGWRKFVNELQDTINKRNSKLNYFRRIFSNKRINHTERDKAYFEAGFAHGQEDALKAVNLHMEEK